MDGIRFIDIYASKGFEYLVVIAFLLAFAFFANYLASARPLQAASAALAHAASRFRVPEGVFFHQGHSWVRPEHGTVGVVGLDDFAQKLVGRVDSLRLPAVGTKLSRGGAGWSLVVDDKAIHMLAPVDGEVVAVNPALEQRPELLREDPYGKGWLLKVRSPRIDADTRRLFSGKVARAWMESALDRLAAAHPGAAGPALADGGLPVEGLARELGGDDWHALARTHLLTEDV